MKLELTSRDDRYVKIKLPNSMGLPRLKCLILNLVISFDTSFSKIISSCPVLETLIARTTHGSGTSDQYITINSSTLKHLEIKDRGYSTGKLTINTPNLTSFVCQDHMRNNYCLEELPSLVAADIEMYVEAHFDGDHNVEFPEAYLELSEELRVVFAEHLLKFLRALHGVKELKLSPGFFEIIGLYMDEINSSIRYDLDLQPVTSLPDSYGRCNFTDLPVYWTILHFSSVTEVELWLTRGCLDVISHLLKISPNIESIYITSKECENFNGVWEPVLPQPCMLSHLKFIEIGAVQGYDNQLKLLGFLLKNAIALEDVRLYFRFIHCLADQRRRVSEFSKKLKALPRASSSQEEYLELFEELCQAYAGISEVLFMNQVEQSRPKKST
ncbi:F-box protein At3g62430-like [Papaver somniferum]|uniref:F-box protein At3g62430-like n=1 Tax=Papaver somniferum TaxID=3469 RepID=UPI000E7052E2|nr:F-box protein At3g62430-like [Papaver somniferum]